MTKEYIEREEALSVLQYIDTTAKTRFKFIRHGVPTPLAAEAI